jgi:hypothetical protein
MFWWPRNSGGILVTVLLSWNLSLPTSTEAFTASYARSYDVRTKVTRCLSSGIYDPVATSLNSLTEAGTGESDAAAGDDSDDEEFHSIDRAQSTTQFLSGLWQLIAQGNQMTRGVSDA